MNYDFETLVKRRPANLKQSTLPENIRKAGNVSFDGSEPDYKTAPVIEQAVIHLAENGLYGFTLCDELYRERVRWWMEHSRGQQISPDWVVPTLGTIHSLASVIRMVCKEEEGIIVTTPVYNRYEQAASRLNRRTVKCPLILEAGRYRMDFDSIERAMEEPGNRIFVLCNPHNPLGQVWSREELGKLAALANRYGVFVFSDEIFADNCYGEVSSPCYLDIPNARNHAIVAISLGKSFHFTGVNHANILIANAELRRDFEDRRTRDHYGSIDPLAYEAVIAAYTEEGLDWLCAANTYVQENIRLIRDFFLEHLPGVAIYGGEGGYILWMDWRAYFTEEEVLQDFLYQKALFHLDMGSSYGAPCFSRMCVASPRWCIKKALNTLERALGELKV